MLIQINKINKQWIVDHPNRTVSAFPGHCDGQYLRGTMMAKHFSDTLLWFGLPFIANSITLSAVGFGR